MRVLPDDFKDNLVKTAHENLTPEQINFGEAIWKKLSDDKINSGDLYLIILQGIRLLSDLKTHVEDDRFKKEFEQIKLLPHDRLMHIRDRLMSRENPTEEECSPTPLVTIQVKTFQELAKILTGTPHITKAEKIGEGHYGIVYKVNEIARPALSQLPNLAMKVPILYEDSATSLEAENDFKSEFNFLTKLHESSKLTDAEKAELAPKPIKVTYGSQVAFLTKYCEGGNLTDYIKKHPLTDEQKSGLAKQLIYKMSLLSKAGAVYTDIKPENILVDPKTQKISWYFSDFGSCYFADDPTQLPEDGFTGTPCRFMFTDFTTLYQAAYQAKKDPDNKDKQAELEKMSNQHLSRALGIILCEVFKGETIPFKHSYSLDDLNTYLTTFKPLQSVQDPHLADIIVQLLGSDGTQLAPQEAWSHLKSEPANQ